jgi:AraC family transcriptional regulator
MGEEQVRFLAHLTRFYCDQPAILQPARGGLAPWQRRTKGLLLSRMDGKVGLAELAGAIPRALRSQSLL